MRKFNVTNVRHGINLGTMTEQEIVDQWPQADLSGEQFRAGKFYLVCEEIKPKKTAKPKKKAETTEAADEIASED